MNIFILDCVEMYSDFYDKQHLEGKLALDLMVMDLSDRRGVTIRQAQALTAWRIAYGWDRRTHQWNRNV